MLYLDFTQVLLVDGIFFVISRNLYHHRISQDYHLSYHHCHWIGIARPRNIFLTVLRNTISIILGRNHIGWENSLHCRCQEAVLHHILSIHKCNLFQLIERKIHAKYQIHEIEIFLTFFFHFFEPSNWFFRAHSQDHQS